MPQPATHQPRLTTETFAVALVGETDTGWLVEAQSAGEAADWVHRTRARDCWRSELLVWNESYYRQRYLGGDPFPPTWIRLSAPTRCPACATGYLFDPGGTHADLRCMIETDAGADGLILEAGCGYRRPAEIP